ncbi:DinB family protein [Streptomyces orinoci]|uniref:DinB family protein n=1 Tax=Streptomyces orinoci TaxID=67339 RepID=A0ABV3K0H1_STRON|nr:DinB family protein [Streptomyces orinoci]
MTESLARPMRPMPPMNADERTTLTGWLDFQRATLAMKCDGLTDEQLRSVSVPPSPMTLQGLVQHMAEVERNWFRRVLAGEDAPPIFDPRADPEGRDGGFELDENVTFAEARAIWQEEIAAARANCAARPLEHTSAFMGGEVSLRWIHTHMIGEYARHNGHADLLRERIDGLTGF